MGEVSWVFDPAEWNRTRVVEVFQAEDGLWYWRRSRIKGGVTGKVVAVSGGFFEEHWARVSATKENYPLPVQPPLLEATDVPPGDEPVDPDVEPSPGPTETVPVPDEGEGAEEPKAKPKKTKEE